MEVKYKKWIVLGVGVWLSLYSIFWATTAYGYDGFLISMINIGAIVIIAYRFQKNNINSKFK